MRSRHREGVRGAGAHAVQTGALENFTDTRRLAEHGRPELFWAQNTAHLGQAPETGQSPTGPRARGCVTSRPSAQAWTCWSWANSICSPQLLLGSGWAVLREAARQSDTTEIRSARLPAPPAQTSLVSFQPCPPPGRRIGCCLPMAGTSGVRRETNTPCTGQTQARGLQKVQTEEKGPGSL